MKTTRLLQLAAVLGASFMLVAPSQAGSIKSCTGGTGDYSDAPASYGVACHDTNKWQQLGKLDPPLNGAAVPENDFDNPGWTSESSPNAVDAGDDGVKWATSTDGVNFGPYGTTDDLVQGQFVKFQMDVNRSQKGGHNYDEYKLWLDWFGTGSFNESDVQMNGQWVKNQTSDGTLDTTGTGNNNALGTKNSSQEFASFFSSVIQVPVNAFLGEVWMRARVACDFSFNTAGDFLATGYYHQGEVEDYAMRIVKHVNAPVSALLFSALGLGLMVQRRRRQL
jgi:hypothetical protein